MLVSIGENNFQQEVLRSSCPVIVSFWAPWCHLCHRVEPLLQQWQATSAPEVKLVRVNADENFRLTRDYNLKSIPAILLFDDGKLVSHHSLQGDRSQIQSVLDQVLRQLPVTL